MQVIISGTNLKVQTVETNHEPEKAKRSYNCDLAAKRERVARQPRDVVGRWVCEDGQSQHRGEDEQPKSNPKQSKKTAGFMRFFVLAKPLA